MLSVFWFVGGTDPDNYTKAKADGRINELPVNHSPKFAPVIHPTLETGIKAIVSAALAWVAPDTFRTEPAKAPEMDAVA